MQISRRNVLKMAGAAALGAAAAPALAAGTAEAAGTSGPPPVGTMYVQKLWGMKWIKVRERSRGRMRTVRIKVPATRPVFRGTGSSSINRGLGVLGDSSPIGSVGHAWIFGHRTSHGGPFRNLHKLVAGDIIDVLGFRYQVLAAGTTVDAYIWQRHPITNAILTYGRGRRKKNKRALRLNAVTGKMEQWTNNEGVLRPPSEETFGPIAGSLSLITCSQQNRLPTNTDFRLIVHSKLLGPVLPPV